MTARSIRAVAVGALAAWFLAQGHAADLPREMHGRADAYVEPGMALAWAVLRGTNEDSTTVVLRIVTDAAVFAEVAVTGVDPFTGQQRVIRAQTPSAGVIDVRVPRAHFAAFPRTELQFFAAGADRMASLRVFYLGVPDTTPEFVDDAKLDAYLRARIAQAQRSTPR